MVDQGFKQRALRFAKKAEKYVRIGSDIGGALLEVKKDARPYQMAAAGVRVAHNLLKHAHEVVDEGDNGWDDLFHSEIYLDKWLSKWMMHQYPSHETTKGGPHAIDFEGYAIRYYPYENLAAREGEREEVRNLLGRRLWEYFGPRLKMIASCENRSRRTILAPWDETETLPSEMADYLHDRISNRGAHRVLLHGPPGTGKSCMAKRVAYKMGGTCLTIDVGSLEQFGSAAEHAIENAVWLLQPTSIIIDDIDRTEYTHFLLNLFEGLEGRMVIASVNDVENLDAALLRPGRFDDLIEVRNVGSDVVQYYLDQIPSHLHERAGVLPIAFLSELVKRKGDPEMELTQLEEQYALVQRVSGDAAENESKGDEPTPETRRAKRHLKTSRRPR